MIFNTKVQKLKMKSPWVADITEEYFNIFDLSHLVTVVVPPEKVPEDIVIKQHTPDTVLLKLNRPIAPNKVGYILWKFSPPMSQRQPILIGPISWWEIDIRKTRSRLKPNATVGY